MADMEDIATEDVVEEIETEEIKEQTFDDETISLLKRYKIDPDNVTTDDLASTIKRLAKAEETKIKEKRGLTEVKGITPEELDLRDEVTEFLGANPAYKEYKTELLKYRKGGYNLKQAQALIDNSDASIQNREKLNSMNVTAGEDGAKKSSYTKAEFSELEGEEYEKVAKLIKAGKMKLR